MNPVLSVKRLKQPRSLDAFLGKDSHLRKLVDQVNANAALLQSVQQWLPSPLEQHCQAAHILDGQLVLYTDSPAWVMRLRFSAPKILEGLRPTSPNLRGVRVRVQLPQPPRQRPQQKPVLSTTARDILREAASGLDNPDLQAALMRLSQLAERKR